MLTIAIVTKDRPVELQECIDSFVDQLGKDDEVIIIDGSSHKKKHIYEMNKNLIFLPTPPNSEVDFTRLLPD